MTAWWNALSALQQVFYLLAIPGTLILVLQTLLLLFGLGSHSGDHDQDVTFDHDQDATFDHDQDAAFDHDQDTVCDHDHDAGADHAGGLRLLTVRGLVAFLAVSGWVGVAALDLGLPNVPTVLLAAAAGVGAMVLVAVLLKASLRLQQTGNLDLRNALGLTAEVYVPLRGGNRGKVTMVLQERFLELDAVCPDADCPMGSLVRVTSVSDSGLLTVEPLKK